MAATLSKDGIWVRVTQALRTIEEQDALYAQGRTAPGKIVTNAPGGYSQHNFGLAVDVVPSVPGDTYIPDWNPAHPSWQKMIALGESLGLYSGSHFRTFPDAPHFEYTGPYPPETSDLQRETLKSGGLIAVWDAVTAYYAEKS